jgi:hypothetical protein
MAKKNNQALAPSLATIKKGMANIKGRKLDKGVGPDTDESISDESLFRQLMRKIRPKKDIHLPMERKRR